MILLIEKWYTDASPSHLLPFKSSMYVTPHTLSVMHANRRCKYICILLIHMKKILLKFTGDEMQL